MKCTDCNYYWKDERKGDEWPRCQFRDIGEPQGDTAPCEWDWDDPMDYDPVLDFPPGDLKDFQ